MARRKNGKIIGKRPSNYGSLRLQRRYCDQSISNQPVDLQFEVADRKFPGKMGESGQFAGSTGFLATKSDGSHHK